MPEYKLYYDAAGRVITYSLHNQPGNYIVITREQYAEGRFDVVVIDGEIRKPNSVILKMQKTPEGTACNKYDINILDDHPDSYKWSTVAHERR